jgi:hypothetical protein
MKECGGGFEFGEGKKRLLDHSGSYVQRNEQPSWGKDLLFIQSWLRGNHQPNNFLDAVLPFHLGVILVPEI